MARSFRDWDSQQNFKAILGMIQPLLEKKMEFLKEMQERKLTSQEQIEKNKIDFEYSKLDAQVNTDKDRMALDKWKAIEGFKNNISLGQLHNEGIVNVANIQRMDHKDVAEIQTAAQKYQADATLQGKQLDLLGNVLGHTGNKAEYGEDGTTLKSMTTNPAASGMATRIASRTGMGPQPVSQVDVDHASIRLMDMEKTSPNAADNEYRRMQVYNPDLYEAVKLQAGPSQAPPDSVGNIAATPPQPQIAGQATTPAPASRKMQSAPVSIGSMNTGVVPNRGDVFLGTGEQPTNVIKKRKYEYDPLGSLSNQ